MVGEVIEHYKILQRIGEGGMGTVYRALDTMLEREVALKLLRTDLSDQPDVSQRFRAEAVALARLSHPHIATLFGLVRRESQLCMVMELVRGETLAELMKEEPGFACERAVRLAMQILAALDYAHESGIVHRDIKPSNVIVAPSGVAKVLDFGIARVLDSDRMTRQGLIVGTPQYMSPEQIRGEEIDGRADVYAVGVLLYEMIAGRLPFKADTGVGLMYAHLEGVAMPLTEVAPHAPPWLAEIIQRAMAKAPADRLRAGELRKALDEGLSAGIVARANAPTSELAAAPAAARVAPARLESEPTEIHAPPPPTEMQPTVLHGHSTPARPVLAVEAPPVDVFRAPGHEPPSPAVSEPANPTSRRTWLAAAGVLAIGALAVALWFRPSALFGPTESSPPVEAAGPATGAAAAPSSPASAPPTVPAGRPTEPPVPDARAAAPAVGAGRPATPSPGAGDSSAAPPSARPAVDKGAAPPRTDAPVVAAEPPPAPASAAALPAASFDDVVLLVPADRGREEVEVRVTFHPERFVVFDVDAGRIISQVFYRKPAGNPGATVLLGSPRFLTGSERWFVLPTSAGEIVLRLDLDASGDIVSAFEGRSGMRVTRIKGELGG